MKRILMILFVLLFITNSALADSLLIMPMTVFEEDGTRVKLGKDPDKYIYSYLLGFDFDGLIEFSNPSAGRYGNVNSIVDAERVSASSGAEYLMYGYVEKRSDSWYCNIRLFDSRSKKVVDEFFVADSISEFERFVYTINERSLGLVNHLLGRDFLKEKEGRPFEVYFPVNAGWWTPVGNGWWNSMKGIASVSGGVEFFPKISGNVFMGVEVDFSVGARLIYSVAVGGRKKFPLFYNGVGICFPVICYARFSEMHSTYIGLGPYYEFEMMNITQKYLPSEFMYQNMMGCKIYSGYEFSIRDEIKLNAGINGDFHFLGDKYIAIECVMGVKFLLKKKNATEEI